MIFAIGNDTGDGFAVEEGYYVGIPFFSAIGAGVGGITALFKDSNRFEINGDPQKWEQFRAMIEPVK